MIKKKFNFIFVILFLFFFASCQNTETLEEVVFDNNLLKKITLNALITTNIEEKRNLGLKNTVEGVEIEAFK